MFKRKNFQNTVGSCALAVATAMAGMGGAGLSLSANAANISQDGLGQVMIFPYYTARNGFATFFNITNTSNKTVFLKVRWHEGENSRDARDFNVILSPYDIWSVATIFNRNSGAAHARTADNSCTSPILPADGDGSGTTHGIDFTNLAYTGSNKDRGNTGLDRTREGYFTVYEMGVLKEKGAGATIADNDLIESVAASAKHSKVRDNQGIPGADDTDTKTNCDLIDKLFSDDTELAKLNRIVDAPENVLKGRAVLIELTSGVAQGYDPVNLANFRVGANMLALPGTGDPNMDDVFPRTSTRVDNDGNSTTRNFLQGVDAISDLLSRTSIINDYNITGESQTDWVITFPTKGWYVDRKQGLGYNGSFYRAYGPTLTAAQIADPITNVSLPPFENASIFADKLTPGESCVKIGFKLWDREEFEKEDAQSGFSPQGKTPGAEICKEANILSFGNSNIYDSKLRSSLFENNLSGLPGLNGWAKITFSGTTNDAAANIPGVAARGVNFLLPVGATETFTTYGLPVAGMRLEARQNSKFAGKSFGFASEHAYTRD